MLEAKVARLAELAFSIREITTADSPDLLKAIGKLNNVATILPDNRLRQNLNMFVEALQRDNTHMANYFLGELNDNKSI